MTEYTKYEALKADLLADIAKACDDSVLLRAMSTLELLEESAAGATNADAAKGEVAPSLTHEFINTNDDVRRLATVNLVALVAMAAVAITSVVAHK